MREWIGHPHNDVRRFEMKRIYGCKVSATTYDVPVTYFDSETNGFEKKLVTNTVTRNAIDLKREIAGNFGCKTSQVIVGNFIRHTSSLEIDCTLDELVKILDSAGIAHSDIETSK